MEEYTLKNKLKLGAVLGLFFVFTVFFYGPAGIYLSNADELKFGLGVVIKVALIVSVILFLLIVGFSLIVPKKLFLWYMLIFLGVALGFYVQGNYINYNYGVMDGSDIKWGDYTKYGLLNTAIWGICFIVPFIIYLIVRKKDKALINKIVMGICAFLIVIQIPAFISQAMSYKKKNTESLVITTNEMFDYAPDNNIIVFMLDGIDEAYYEDYLTRHPEYEPNLPGFVRYDNAMTGGARTMMGMPIFYSGKPYNRQDTYSAYIDEVYKGDNLLNKMYDAGYNVRVYSETLFYSNDTAKVVDNFEMVSDPVTSEYMLTRKLYKLSLFKFMPHFLKSRFWMDTSEFEAAMTRDNNYEFNDVKFYEEYTKRHINIDESLQKTFTVYHMKGTHRPFNMNRHCQEKGRTNRKEQMAGVFKIVKEMLDEMKQKGIYDSSTILITADHGDLDLCQHMICMLKESGSTDEFRISHAPVSSFDFPIYLASVAGQTMTNDYGTDMLSLAEDEKRTRYLFRNSSDNSRLVVRMYNTDSTADDVDAITQIEEFVDDGEKTPYELGTRLGFDAEDNGNTYATGGFANNHGFRTKLKGPISTLVIPFKEIPKKKITCHIAVHDRSEVVYGMKCVMKVNGTEVYSGEVSPEMVSKGINFEIDPSLFTDENLQIDFTFPEVDMKEMEKDIGDRTTTISIVSIVME